MAEQRLLDARDAFIGKTIADVSFSCCNHIEFSFTDGTAIAIDIEVDLFGLPELLANGDNVVLLRP